MARWIPPSKRRAQTAAAGKPASRSISTPFLSRCAYRWYAFYSAPSVIDLQLSYGRDHGGSQPGLWMAGHRLQALTGRAWCLRACQCAAPTPIRADPDLDPRCIATDHLTRYLNFVCPLSTARCERRLSVSLWRPVKPTKRTMQLAEIPRRFHEHRVFSVASYRSPRRGKSFGSDESVSTRGRCRTDIPAPVATRAASGWCRDRVSGCP